MRRELHDHPGERDVLHPRAGDRRRAGRRRRGGSCGGCRREAKVRADASSQQRHCAAPRGASRAREAPPTIASRSLVGQALAGARRARRCGACGRWRGSSRRPVVSVSPIRRRSAARVRSISAGRLEPRDVPRHSGRRHPLALGELGGGDPGILLDLDEQRDLAAGDAERLGSRAAAPAPGGAARAAAGRRAPWRRRMTFWSSESLTSLTIADVQQPCVRLIGAASRSARAPSATSETRLPDWRMPTASSSSVPIITSMCVFERLTP